jgi:hypothetical protein
MAMATTCRAVSGYTAGSSTSRTARAGSDAASSGRASHMSARGRSAVRYVSRPRAGRSRPVVRDTRRVSRARGCASVSRARAGAEPAPSRRSRARARPEPGSRSFRVC